ncbi:MAG: hypothetical protein ACOC22_00490 [bacterium]
MATLKIIKIESDEMKKALSEKDTGKVKKLFEEKAKKYYNEDMWVTVNLWEKYGKSRMYININEPRGFDGQRTKLMDSCMIDLQEENLEIRGHFNFKNEILNEVF